MVRRLGAARMLKHGRQRTLPLAARGYRGGGGPVIGGGDCGSFAWTATAAAALCVADAEHHPVPRSRVAQARDSILTILRENLWHLSSAQPFRGCGFLFARATALANCGRLRSIRCFLQALCRDSQLGPTATLAALDELRTDMLIETLADAVAYFDEPWLPPERRPRAAALTAGAQKLRKKFGASRSLSRPFGVPALPLRQPAGSARFRRGGSARCLVWSPSGDSRISARHRECWRGGFLRGNEKRCCF